MTNTDQGSAKIYQFPARGRFAAAGRHDETKPAALFAPQAVNAAVGAGWYHDQAIQDADRTRKN